MKRFNTTKQVLLGSLLGMAGTVNAQIHPLAFGSVGGAYTKLNWYANYVGVRVEVVAPSGTPPGIVGDKQYTTTNDGSGATGLWGGAVTSPFINEDIIMPPSGDSVVLPTGFALPDMTGKIAVVYRGGNIEFGTKAKACQAAHADAVVIINNVVGSPIGMGPGKDGASVTIPVFMITKIDGDAIDAVYNSSPSGTVKMTITNWGVGKTNDLGFVPAGLGLWHAYAVPADQLSGTGLSAYKQVDGAFIANYGSTTQSGVKVSGMLQWTATGSTTPTSIHTDSVTLPSFPTADSIWAMFDTLTANNEYDVTATGTGRFDLIYNISSSTPDDYPGDNTQTASFYATDSIYSKGVYDFVNNEPVHGIGYQFGTNPFIWGNMYYVANGGAAVSRVQYSLDMNGKTGPLDATLNNVYLFKWVDGDRGLTMDSVIQNGELELVGVGVKNYDGVNDTSGAILNVTNIGQDTTNGGGAYVTLQSHTWYYLAIGVPATYFLGCDGSTNPYPRIFGREYGVHHILDYSNMVYNGSSQADIYANYGTSTTPIPANVSFVNVIDSFNYSNSKGVLPAIAMIVNKNPGSIIVDHSAVNNVTKAAIGITVYPNPATDYVTASIDLDKFANSVKYTVIDGMGRIVSETVHNNIQNEKFTINTSILASGSYYLVVNANEKVTFKKFVVAR